MIIRIIDNKIIIINKKIKIIDKINNSIVEINKENTNKIRIGKTINMMKKMKRR